MPKSTLFNWESDPAIYRSINVIKSLQLEKLQEKYLPSFEEELQKLSTCLCRIERALEKQDFEAMRPEFLLRTSLQLRSRLNKLRSDVQPTRTLDTGELPPNPLPGCITRSRTEIPDTHDDADSAPSPRWGEGRGEVSGPSPLEQNVLHPKWDENENFAEPEPSAPATSTGKNGTIVPNCEAGDSSPSPLRGEGRGEVSDSSPCTPSHAHERYGELATPLTNIPAHVDVDQIVLTAGIAPPRGSATNTQPPASRPIPPAPPKPASARRPQPVGST